MVVSDDINHEEPTISIVTGKTTLARKVKSGKKLILEILLLVTDSLCDVQKSRAILQVGHISNFDGPRCWAGWAVRGISYDMSKNPYLNRQIGKHYD